MPNRQLLTITILVIIVIAIAGFSFLLGKESSITGLATADIKADDTKPALKIYTQAVCEEKDFYKDCKDVVYAECGSDVQEIPIINGTARIPIKR